MNFLSLVLIAVVITTADPPSSGNNPKVFAALDSMSFEELQSLLCATSTAIQQLILEKIIQKLTECTANFRKESEIVSANISKECTRNQVLLRQELDAFNEYYSARRSSILEDAYLESDQKEALLEKMEREHEQDADAWFAKYKGHVDFMYQAEQLWFTQQQAKVNDIFCAIERLGQQIEFEAHSARTIYTLIASKSNQ